MLGESLKKIVILLIVVIIALPMIYFVVAIIYVLNYCDWQPRTFNITGFYWKYNDWDAACRDLDPKTLKILYGPRAEKVMKGNKYCTTGFYIRRGQVSQAVEFSLRPFGIRSFPGYFHLKD